MYKMKCLVHFESSSIKKLFLEIILTNRQKLISAFVLIKTKRMSQKSLNINDLKFVVRNLRLHKKSSFWRLKWKGRKHQPEHWAGLCFIFSLIMNDKWNVNTNICYLSSYPSEKFWMRFWSALCSWNQAKALTFCGFANWTEIQILFG